MTPLNTPCFVKSPRFFTQKESLSGGRNSLPVDMIYRVRETFLETSFLALTAIIHIFHNRCSHKSFMYKAQ